MCEYLRLRELERIHSQEACHITDVGGTRRTMWRMGRDMPSSHRKILLSASQENDPSQSTTRPTLGPPMAPRSAFVCFADARKEEMRNSHPNVSVENEILTIVASEWRGLDESVRASWDEVARDDKVRYVREKAEYKGPWMAPKRRAKKHPLAPKRPMSAFLKYSQNRRATIKSQNPDMGNTDVSRLLGEMWRNASEAERRPYIERELRERAEYNEMIKKFREQQAHLDVASRVSHRAVKIIAENGRREHQTDASPPQLSYDPFLPFEPLRIHSAEEAANKVDEQLMLTSLPIPYHHRATAEKSRQRPMFRHDIVSYHPQPLYHHHAAAFGPGRNGYSSDYQANNIAPTAMSQDAPLPYNNSRSSRGPFTGGFTENNFYHYP
ncbi:hypothetical protein MPSEU_000207000 [Mayamaea pseudoterrestris]|nr:hypothetical protein MPSEU_000207000 [Mayamaea pseudoterrestris]